MDTELNTNFTDARYAQFKARIQSQGATYAGNGCSREGWLHKGFVIKIPRNPRGVLDNQLEAKAFRRWKTDGSVPRLYQPVQASLRLARCRILKNDCLLIEYIRREYSYFRMPEWMAYFEGRQGGRNKRGVFKVFDFADLMNDPTCTNSAYREFTCVDQISQAGK